MAAPALYAPLANAMLNLLESQGYKWLQFHVGEPGAAGTSNVAAFSTRRQVTWLSASAGSIEINADITITDVPASEDWSHFTAWTASAAGTVGVSGLVTANTLAASDDVTIDSSSVTVTFTLAS